MVFKRRDRRPIWRILLEALWPRGGWGRAVRYVGLRVNRLPDPPQRIARGIFAGVFTCFTPFYGLHFVISALLAVLMRGNVLAALLATLFGNPLTYVPIGLISIQTGYLLMGLDHENDMPDLEKVSFGKAFMNAGMDLWHNVLAAFGPETADWHGLQGFYNDVFFPYMVGGILPGLVAGFIAYRLSLPVITAFQNRRKGALKARIAALKKKRAEGGGLD